MFRLLGLLSMGVLAACNAQGPSLAGQPGLQWQVISFYDDRAMERSASCPNPRMRSVTRHHIVEDSPQRVVMDIKYYWVDESQAMDIPGGSIITCQDWGERTFTFAKATDGSLQVKSMTGPQKRA